MKKGIIFILCLVALWVGAATIQWFSDQPATSSPADTDIIALERPSPHAYKSATLAILKAYIGTNGTLTVTTLTVDRSTNIYLTTTYGYFTNVYAPNITNQFFYSTNIFTTLLTVNSNAYFYNTNFVFYEFTTNLTVLNNFEVQSNAYFFQTNFENITINTNVAIYSNTYVNLSYTTNLNVNKLYATYLSALTNEVQSLIVTNGITNLSLTANMLVGTDANKKLVSTDTVVAPLYSLSASTNGPAGNEFPVANWVRGLFNNGVVDYSTTNITTGTNTGSPNQVLYEFWTGVIPQPSVRTWVTAWLTNNGYVGSVVTTNTFTFLQGPIAINSYIGMTGGGAAALSIHPEIYYSYDKTNWYGDWEAQAHALSNNATNLHQWVISFPAITATNPAGFYIQRRFKINSVNSTPTLYFLVGTNSASGTSDASHISFSGPNSAIGNAYLANNQTFTGSNTFSGGTYTHSAVISNAFLVGGTFPLLLTWAGPTNTLNMSNQWEYVTYTPCAITNFLGGVSGYALDCSLAISNASSTNITITITATPSKSGDSTNIYYLPSTDVLDLGARSMHGAWVKYLSRAFH